jgi:hypothetical protein
MKSLRKRNALVFDLTLFILFTLSSFLAYVLTESAGSTGAVASLIILSLICLSLIVSR